MDYLLAIILILTPAYVIRFNLFGLPADVLMTAVIFVWLIFAGWLITKKQLADFFVSIRSLDKKLLLFVGGFFLAGVISLFVHGLDRAKLGQFIVLILQPISLFFFGRFIISKFPNSKNLLLVTCYSLLAAAGLCAIIQYLTLLGLPPQWWGNSVEPKRALSFFVHPNFYALWAAPLLAFLIPDVFQKIKNFTISSEPSGESRNLSNNRSLHSSDALVGRDGNKKSAAFIFAWLLGAAGLFLSLSRAGWAGLGAAIIIYLIFAADKKIRRLIFAAAIVGVIIVAAVPNLRWRFILPFYGEKSAVSRFSLWDTGWKGIKESPILGLGLTGFSRQWTTLNTDPGLTDTHNYPHNIFLDLWVETGLIGLISLIGLIGLLIYQGLFSIAPPQDMGRGKGEVDLIKLSIALFLTALLCQGQIDNPYFKNDLAMVFWIILALS